MYATSDELIGSTQAYLVAQLTGTDEPDTVAIDRALDDASAEIDGYVSSRYTLPLPTVPEILRRICIDIALYRMMNFRSLGDIEDARKRYEDAVRFLKDLIRGDVSLGMPETGDNSATASGTAFTKGTSVFEGIDY